MEQLSHAAFAISLVGGLHDVLTRRIPNWLTFPALGLGLAAQFWLLGWAGALNGLLGAALGFALFFPIYLGGYMGAGDVKLQMVVGAWMGWWLALHVAFGAVIVGGVYAFFEVIARGRLVAVFRNGYSFLRALLLPGLVAERLRVDEQRKFAFGICIAASVAGVIYLQHSGRIS
ncbi:MAG TPA: prepilin peptidase [Bdellovibrionota bacterium]|jgi:prepilin peptidase CpaA